MPKSQYVRKNAIGIGRAHSASVPPTCISTGHRPLIADRCPKPVAKRTSRMASGYFLTAPAQGINPWQTDEATGLWVAAGNPVTGRINQFFLYFQ